MEFRIFPQKPDVDFARQIYADVKPIIAACQDDEWRASVKRERNPDVARYPRTNVFTSITNEIKMQTAMAFVAMHGGKGWACDEQSRIANPREWELQKFLYEHPLEQWLWHEVDLRAGAMPIPPDTRAYDLAKLLEEVSNGFFKLVSPPPEDVPMPRENVMLRAKAWYDHNVQGIVEGWHEEPSED